MSRISILPTGAIVYRTKNLPLSLASSFARCLEGNAFRFCDVAISPAKTKANLYSVQFRPVSTERQGALYQAQYDVRVRRAEAESAAYVFWTDPDFPGSHWCHNPRSGETYQVGVFSCTCPDFLFRCNSAAICCKHQIALSLRIARRSRLVHLTHRAFVQYGKAVEDFVAVRTALHYDADQVEIAQRRYHHFTRRFNALLSALADASGMANWQVLNDLSLSWPTVPRLMANP